MSMIITMGLGIDETDTLVRSAIDLSIEVEEIDISIDVETINIDIDVGE